jgi:DNA uptake protein ComE-like DNA-binding protein
MPVKNSIKSYLGFGRRDRIGILALVLLMGLAYSAPYLFAEKDPAGQPRQGQVLEAAMERLEARQKDRPEPENGLAYREPLRPKDFRTGELFPFDPNTLSPEGWQRLGLSERTSKTIDKYRSHGGRFYRPEDLRKIWGVPKGFYERVKDYVVIVPAQKQVFEKTAYTRPEKKIVLVSINEADTSAFIALPLIGSKLAARIVSFRDRLGGFYSVDQVGETYGLPDSSFQKIKQYLRLDGTVRTFNLNTVTKEELKGHPYFKWNLANAIVEYRNQHGAFRSLEELKNLAVVDEGTFEKIVHYLSL